MSDHPSNDTLNADAKELLLEEYRSLSTALLTNEQIGETRVNWLIGIVTAVLGGLTALATAEKSGLSDGTRQLFIIGSLVGLVVLGFITLCRILKRNATTDGFKKDLRRIRDIFRDYYDGESVLLHYHSFSKPSASAEERGREFGGLADLVSALNSLIIAALAGAIFFRSSAVLGCVGAVVAFFLSVRAHRHYVCARHKEVIATLREPPLTHAGGVVFSFDNGVLKYLLARPSDPDATEWILPKGKINPGEDPREAALREVAEETGVRARLLRPLQIMEFKAKDKQVRAKFYLMERIFAGEPIEREVVRAKKWVSFDEAMSIPLHSQTKELLIVAERRALDRVRPSEQPAWI